MKPSAWVFLVLAALAAAQTPTGSPEQQQILAWIGTWNLAGDVRESPFGPPGKIAGRDRVERGPGFTALFHTDLTTPLGKTTSVSTISYDTVTNGYLMHSIDSADAVTTARGTMGGATWTWLTESHVGGHVVKGRDITTFTSPSTYTWTFEIEAEDGVYVLIEQGRATKVR